MAVSVSQSLQKANEGGHHACHKKNSCSNLPHARDRLKSKVYSQFLEHIPPVKFDILQTLSDGLTEPASSQHHIVEE